MHVFIVVETPVETESQMQYYEKLGPSRSDKGNKGLSLMNGISAFIREV
jgi:hypothetical protein